MASRGASTGAMFSSEAVTVEDQGVGASLPADLDDDAEVLMAVDGAAACVALIGDRLRLEADQLMPRLRVAGIRHVAMVTGDKCSVAEAVGERLGVDRVYAD